MFNIQPNFQADGSSMESSASSSRILSPQEQALQSLCKQLLKSRLFRGFYLERRFVNSLNNYRDIISLQRSERELEKILLDMKKRLEMFYTHSTTPNMWIGVTHGPLTGVSSFDAQAGALDTFVWVELDELAFGQYWFSIKSIRFRQREIILKLKVVREVEDESNFLTPMRTKKRINPTTKDAFEAPTEAATTTNALIQTQMASTHQMQTTAVEQQIDWQDFVDIVRNWGTAIKQNVYEFMAKDINKENLKGLLRLFGLLLLSVVSGSIVGIKFLGVFTLRFMFEFSRLTHVMTPIILKIIEVFNKIIGGFYILVAMVWRDTFGKRLAAPPIEARMNFREIDYNKPLHRAIQYDIKQQNQKKYE